jgi:putative ABC transport system permease protein
MTALIRGFDSSLRDMIRSLGPNTIFVGKVSAVSLTSGADFATLMRRPNLTIADAKAIEKLAPSVETVDVWLGQGPGQNSQERVYYRAERTRQLAVIGATEKFGDVNFVPVAFGRFFTAAEVEHRKRVVVLGYNPYEALFQKMGLDPIGKKVRVGAIEYTVVGVLQKRPSVIGDQDDFVVIPQTTHQLVFGAITNNRGFGATSATIVLVPYKDVPRDKALAEVEEIMRIRHGLKLDEADDFDVVTQDAALKVWDQVSQATLLGLVVISSIALMVGGIGVMAIMTISVTERTREIGLRKALGARRREVLVQFLTESVVLTVVGGLLGIALGAGIGVAVHTVTGFPISLPWWSFALGLGFSAAVGIFFGMVPAVRASRLDPIEALRHE